MPRSRGGVLRRIKQCLGVLGLMGLAAASLSMGTASAATQGSVGTKARWQAAKGPVAPDSRLAPKPVVGDGNDYSAVVTGLISQATGTFTNVSPGITERGKVGGVRANRANAFSLQLNSQFFTGSPECAGP